MSLFFFQKHGISQVSWAYCEKEKNDFHLLNLTVGPDPLLAPGNGSVAIKIFTTQNLTNPFKVRANVSFVFCLIKFVF